MRYEHGTDYQLLLGSGAIFLLILLVVLSWVRKLAQLNSRIQSYLLLINQNLLLVTLNKEGIIVDSSEAFCDWSGMSADQLIGMDHAEYFAPDKTEILDDSRHDEGYMEMLFQPQGGEPRHIEIHPLEGMGGSSGETRYIIHDISEKIQGLKNRHEQRILDQKMAILSDMHDGFGGVITALSMAADNALRKKQVDEKNQALRDIADLAKEGATEMRLMMNALENRDFSWEALISDLRQIANILLSGGRMQLNFHRPATLPQSSLQQEDYFSLYRWFKEAVTNAVKHSGASQLDISISWQESLFEVRVKDNGRGFALEPDSRGHGLRSLSSRAADLGAELSIASSAGTELTLKIPLNKG